MPNKKSMRKPSQKQLEWFKSPEPKLTETITNDDIALEILPNASASSKLAEDASSQEMENDTVESLGDDWVILDVATE